MGKTKRLDDIIRLKKELKEANETIRKLEHKLIKKEQEPDSDTSKRQQRKVEKAAQKELDSRDKCPGCKTGEIIISDLGIRLISTCSKKCGWRNITKHGKKEEGEKVQSED